jgi:hypothetical protein
MEKGNEYSGITYQLFMDFKEAYDTFRREVLWSVLIEFVIPVKLVILTKICLNETLNKVFTVKNMSHPSFIQNDVKKEVIYP